jgi:transcriptional regulator with XRE-family HTH domain
MPRYEVTPGLAETLRAIRLQNKIQANKLATHIGKSPAYISKLENGSIQTIAPEELSAILKFISGEDHSVELAEQIYASLKVKYTAKEIEEQLWFINYDTVECRIPLPRSLLEDLAQRITDLGITHKYLCSRINANEALTPEEIADESLPYNQWYQGKKAEGSQSIKIKLTEKQLSDLLGNEFELVPYVFIFCIAFYILKIEKYGDIVSISDEENASLMRATTDLLNSHKFYSISEKNLLIANKQTSEDVNDLLSSFDKDNMKYISDILSGFSFATDHNIKHTNEQLKAFAANMHWDLGFMLRIIGLNYKCLEETSVSNKRQLLSEIEALIQKYAAIPKEQNLIEEY